VKRLFVCCDGTWQSEYDRSGGVPVPSNVVRFHNCLRETDPRPDGSAIEQLRFYHPGVGATATGIVRILDGAFGFGLARDVRIAYKWLADHYNVGDRIFVVGFSRGAFTARSVVGMVERCGLPPKPSWGVVDEAFRLFRRADDDLGRVDAITAFRKRNRCPDGPPIEFVGVWDTVGALGIPSMPYGLGLLRARMRFHDTELSPWVKHARHALAIDEMRGSFFPTLWTSTPNDGHTLEQVWFAGVHADVGGGYREIGLSDVTLMWMIGQAGSCGAAFDAQMVGQIRPEALDVVHDSLTGVFDMLDSRPRTVPDLNSAGTSQFRQSVASSVRDRRVLPPIAQAPYWPSRRLGTAQSMTFTVNARERWNPTGLYCEAGASYRFTVAPGQKWLDGWIRCSADGYFGWPWQWPFALLKRVRRGSWFCLCGAVAEGTEPSVHGDPPMVTEFTIGAGPYEFTSVVSGYLFCFANDAWWSYANNHGSIVVEVAKL